MPSFTPILIDTVDVGLNSQKQPGNAGAGINAINMVDKIGPIVSGVNQYLVMGPGLFNGVAQVWKSSDGGNTWNKMDAAHAPACRNWCAFYNKATGKFVIAYLLNANVGAIESVNLIGFNTATDLYENVAGNPGASPGQVHAVFTCVQRSDNSVVIFGIDDSGAPGSYKYLIWSGAAWSITAFDVQGTAQTQSVTCCLDSNDRTHILTSTGAGVSYNVNYWNLTAGNVLTGPTVFGWVTASGMAQQFAPRIDVSDALDTLYIGNWRTAAGISQGRIFFGSPRSAPVWNGTFQGTLIGSLPAGTNASAEPYISVGSDGNLYFVGIASTLGTPQVWMFQVPISNNPISGWNLSTPFDPNFSTVPLTAFPTEPTIAVTNKAKLFFNAATGATGITRFFLGLPNPPGKGVVNITGRNPFPRRLPWVVGKPRITEGRHFFVR